MLVAQTSAAGAKAFGGERKDWPSPVRFAGCIRKNVFPEICDIQHGLFFLSTAPVCAFS